MKVRQEVIPEMRCSMVERKITKSERRDKRLKECEVRGRARRSG